MFHCTHQARNYLSSLPSYPKKDFEAFERFFVGADPNAADLLLKLLDMDPDRRPTAAEALDHPYLAKYHDPEDEVSLLYDPQVFCCKILLFLQPECDRQYDDSFENMELDVEGWRSELRLSYGSTIITPSSFFALISQN